MDFALTVNGSIPAPTLEFTEGDDAEITVHNKLTDEETSIHWHGLLLPSLEDGVSYVNTPPIFPGKSRTFKFKIRQHGTYWYHSHTMVQEQKGVYGAFIIHPKQSKIKVDKEAVVVISDWSDENADQILKNLKKDGDYYLYKKHSVRSIWGAVKAGQLGTYFSNEVSRMGGMDLSDVGYDAFLINGLRSSQLLDAHVGETVRLRIINAAASSYFYISLSGLPFTVIAADGVNIKPLQTKELLMGMAETYDITFTLPDHKNYELRATAQDISGYASAWIGMHDKIPAPHKLAPDLYAPMNHGEQSHNSHQNHHQESKTSTDHDHQANHDESSKKTPDTQNQHHNHERHDENKEPKIVHDHTHHHSQQKKQPILQDIKALESILDTATVDDLQSETKTSFDSKIKVTELSLILDGDMERYVWHINGKAIHEDRNILIHEGDVIRFKFINNTMMHHPMHLHGHFFRVINQYGEKSPLKHTVDVPPHGERTIEFLANERGQWMLHCHNLYHMKTGMARVIKYMSYQPDSEISALEKQDPHLHDHWYTTGKILGASNKAELSLKALQTWNEVDLKLETKKDEDWEIEGDLFYKRWFGNYLNFIGGTSYTHETTRAQIGAGYILPLLIETHFLIDHKGKLRVDLEKKLQWTSTLSSELEYTWRQDKDFTSESSVNLMYSNDWSWAAGLTYTGYSLGAGFLYKF